MSNENISAEARRVAIKNAVIEITNEMAAIDARKQQIKDIVSHVSSEYDISKPELNSIARMHYKANKSEVQEKTDNLMDKYDELFG